MKQHTNTTMLPTFIWALSLETIQDRKIDILIAIQENTILRGLVVPGSFCLGPHTIDLSELVFTARGFTGNLGIVIHPDAWFPVDGQPIPCQLQLQVDVTGEVCRGTFTGLASNIPVQGIISGSKTAAPSFPATRHASLVIEQAAPGWIAHMSRGVMTLAFEAGIPSDFLLRSTCDYAWVARFERVDVRLDDVSLSGEVQALVGMQPGSTDLAAERILYRFDAVIVGDTLAGRCTISGPDGSSVQAVRGTISAGPSRLERPIIARNASTATLAIDTRYLSSPRHIRPWKTIQFDPVFHGGICGVADLDGDGQAEILSARRDNKGTACVLATRLDSSVLWRWQGGDLSALAPGGLPVQVADLDGDGCPEVYVAAQGQMVILDGATGQERRRFPLPADIADVDVIITADLSGRGRPGELLVKDRHSCMYAMRPDGTILWRHEPGQEIAHHPWPIDLDGDGRDEILAGWNLLGPDGVVRWPMQSQICDLHVSHLDSACVVQSGKEPKDQLLAVCFDEANGLALIDGTGKTLWEVAGSHFHLTGSGRMMPGVEGSQIVCALARLRQWSWRVWMMSIDGRLLAEYLGLGLPAFLDWDGDGYDEIIASRGIILRATGEPVAQLTDENGKVFPSQSSFSYYYPFLADVDGDGRPEILLGEPSSGANPNVNDGVLRIYKNEATAQLPSGTPIGIRDFTYYHCPTSRSL